MPHQLTIARLPPEIFTWYSPIKTNFETKVLVDMGLDLNKFAGDI